MNASLFAIVSVSRRAKNRKNLFWTQAEIPVSIAAMTRSLLSLMSRKEFDFVRSHGLGNDYLVVDSAALGFELTPARVRQICHRNTGIGSDGILALVPATSADFALRIFNPDGSEAEKSGNGLRIFARFLTDHGYTTKKDFTVDTLGGVVRVGMLGDGGVRVEMGRAMIDPTLTRLDVAGQTRNVTSLSVGNPHCVIIVDDLTKADLFKLGPLIETHPAFPNRTNVQFAQVLSRRDVRAWIWERGAGHTLASGSSACAVATACYAKGLVDDSMIIHMEGGDLKIEIDPQLNLVMTGPVEEICTGKFSGELRRRLLASK
jgi:diaminopimelate epimerase